MPWWTVAIQFALASGARWASLIDTSGRSA
jgi:hypothetical protein